MVDSNSRLAKWSSLAQEPRSRGCLNLQIGDSGQELRLGRQPLCPESASWSLPGSPSSGGRNGYCYR